MYVIHDDLGSLDYAGPRAAAVAYKHLLRIGLMEL
jgi:hypothetical protein